MIYLIKKGLPPDKAFKIMESVRKGKVAKGKEPKWEEYKQIMKEHEEGLDNIIECLIIVRT